MAIPPAGLTPAGFFVPQSFALPTDAPAILADAVDPESGEYLSISRGMDPVDQQVLIALTVERNSGAAVADDGHDFKKIRKIDDTTERLIEAETRRALRRLTEQRDVKIVRVYPRADPDGDWGEVSVDYHNTRVPASARRLAKVTP